MLEEALPDAAMLGAVAPIAVDGGAGALAAAHGEKTAAGAAAVFLRGGVERGVAFESAAVRLHEIDAVFVRPSAVARRAVALDAPHRRRGVGIARAPDARRRGAVVAEEHPLDLVDHGAAASCVWSACDPY